MKNIHVLPTNKPSVLYKRNDLNTYHLRDFDVCSPNDYRRTNQHIYITSDEEIKTGGWYENNGVIFKADNIFDEGNNPNNSNPRVTNWNKKVILTTDQDLIKDGLQAIDDVFLEWFIKKPSCEFVEVEIGLSDDFFVGGYNFSEYKIIIPNEEPEKELSVKELNRIDDIEIEEMSNDWKTMSQQIQSKQSTELEDVAELNCESITHPYCHREKAMFIKGATWQQKRMYSEEDMKQFAFECVANFLSDNDNWNDLVDKCFEQFKKK